MVKNLVNLYSPSHIKEDLKKHKEGELQFIKWQINNFNPFLPTFHILHKSLKLDSQKLLV
jgi:hypothetical protein